MKGGEIEMVEQSHALTIATMPIQASARLTSDRLKALCLIVEREFTCKESLYHQIQEREKEKIIEAYRRDVGFDKLTRKREELNIQRETIDTKVKAIEEDMGKLGLDVYGQPQASYTTEYTSYGTIRHANYKAIALQKKLQTLEENAPSQNLRAKLITRLQLATTIGEANVIMSEVLGNGLLPKLTVEQVQPE